MEAATNVPRAGAMIGVVGTTRGTISDSTGRFVIGALAPGATRLHLRLLGYRVVDTTVVVTANDTARVDFRLQLEVTVLGAVRTEARPVDREAFEAKPNVGTLTMGARAMESVPRFGERDIIRVVQLLPGVEARNDFSTGFNVRGGESDQNLILLDGFPIYNPFHLGGLFSTFMDPTVRGLTLLTGGFPSRYGGRLSSVLDVQSSEDARSGVHASSEVSVLASTSALSGAFDGGRGSWLVAGRRTYADKFVALISNNELPYHFRDEQAHVTYDLPGGARLTVTGYEGRDALDANIAELGDSTGGTSSAGTFKFNWGNQVGGVGLSKTLRRVAGDSLVLEQRLSESAFSTTLDIGAGSLTLHNVVIDRRVAGAATAYGPAHETSAGYELVSHHIDYTARSPQASTSAYDLHQAPTSAGAYLDDLWRLTPTFLLESGARVETMTGTGWIAFSPRVSAKYFLSRDLAVTAAVGRFTQAMHSLGREDIPIRLFDFWVASDSTTPVSSAWHYIMGVEQWMGINRYLRVEGFYKRYDSLLESNPAEDPARRGDEFFPVNGESYGADLLLRQLEAGPLSGWIAYTYAVASRVRDGLRYYPGHDRRHDVNVVANWRVGRYVLGARYGYATGTPYTPIIGEIERRVYDVGRNAWDTGGTHKFSEFVGGPRNAARLPSTQRFDISATRDFQWRGAALAPYLSVVNASNAKNVFFYVWDYSAKPPTRVAVSQFPFLPSAGLTVKF